MGTIVDRRACPCRFAARPKPRETARATAGTGLDARGDCKTSEGAIANQSAIQDACRQVWHLGVYRTPAMQQKKLNQLEIRGQAKLDRLHVSRLEKRSSSRSESSVGGRTFSLLKRRSESSQ